MYQVKERILLVEALGLLHNLGDGCRGQNRGRDGRGTATGAIACIAQLGSATAVAGRRQLSRHGDSRRGTATAVTERRQPSPRRQPSRKGYEDHQSATAYSITIGLSRRLALATPVAKWRWVSPYMGVAMAMFAKWRWVSPNGDEVIAVIKILHGEGFAMPRRLSPCGDSRRQGCATGPLCSTDRFPSAVTVLITPLVWP